MQGATQTFRSTRPLKGVFIAGALFFPAAASELFFGIGLSPGDTAFTRIVATLGAVWLGYLSWLALLLVRHADDVIEVTPLGLMVRSQRGEATIDWGTPFSVREQRLHQMMWIKGGDGRTLTVVDYWLPGFEELRSSLRMHLGETSDRANPPLQPTGSAGG